MVRSGARTGGIRAYWMKDFGRRRKKKVVAIFSQNERRSHSWRWSRQQFVAERRLSVLWWVAERRLSVLWVVAERRLSVLWRVAERRLSVLWVVAERRLYVLWVVAERRLSLLCCLAKRHSSVVWCVAERQSARSARCCRLRRSCNERRQHRIGVEKKAKWKTSAIVRRDTCADACKCKRQLDVANPPRTRQRRVLRRWLANVVVVSGLDERRRHEAERR